MIIEICTFGLCPICHTGDDLTAIKELKKNAIGFYCYGCGCVWKDIPADMDLYITIDEFTTDVTQVQILTPNEAKSLDKGDFKVFKENIKSVKDYLR